VRRKRRIILLQRGTNGEKSDFATAITNHKLLNEHYTELLTTGKVDGPGGAKYYDDNGLTVQSIAVAKKAEKLRTQLAAANPKETTAGVSEPLFSRPVPKSPLFEVLTEPERDALIREMDLESHEEGSVIISEGQPGASMYVIASGEVKVFTNGAKGASVYLAKLGEGDFFGA